MQPGPVHHKFCGVSFSSTALWDGFLLLVNECHSHRHNFETLYVSVVYLYESQYVKKLPHERTQ